MSWEWRAFWSDRERKVDVFELLGVKRGSGTDRTDVYVSCTSDVGIKWRGERDVEVKVRSERDERTGAEKWDKIVSRRAPIVLDLNQAEEIKKYLVSLLDKLIINNREYESQLSNAKTILLTSPTLKLDPLAKERFRASKDWCSIEQTYLTHPRSGQTHQSVCLEGSHVCIERVLESQTKDGRKLREVLLSLNAVLCGYPEFILKL